LIPLLKKLGFIDSGNVPTQAYKDFREDTLSGTIMAQRIREAYPALFAANEYAYKMNKTDLLSKLRSITGAADDDKTVPAVANTFTELSKLASWNGAAPPKKQATQTLNSQEVQQTGKPTGFGGDFGISYTINLNLPATTEIDVLNAIFKSLRENLLRQP
jgi:hypothetical protein